MAVPRLICNTLSSRTYSDHFSSISVYVSDCIRAEMTDAQPLDVIALKMMKNETSSEDNEKLCLQHSDQ